MKRIKKDELYEHIGRFLQSKGIELKEGSYTKGIHAGCSLLADAINLSQTGIQRAKEGLDRSLEQVRQVIHEKTAPQRSAKGAGAPPVIPKDPTFAGPNGKRRPKAKSKAQTRKSKAPSQKKPGRKS